MLLVISLKNDLSGQNNRQADFAGLFFFLLHFSIVLFQKSAEQFPAHRILASGRGKAFQNQLIFYACYLQLELALFFFLYKRFAPVQNSNQDFCQIFSAISPLSYPAIW